MSQGEPRTPAPSLHGITVLMRLPSDTLVRIERRCTWRHYQPGQLIVDHLDASSDVYFISAGEARATLYSALGKVVTFSELKAGDMFGEIAAIDESPRSASIEAVHSCEIASMSAHDFREMLRAEPEVMLALLRNMARKIRQLTTRIFEFSVLGVANRIQAEVLRLAMLAPREGKGAVIAEMPTHADIASLTSTHREAVTRELNRLVRKGLIERRGRALVVKDVEHLAVLVHEATGE